MPKKNARVQKDLKGFSCPVVGSGMTLHKSALIFYSNMSAMDWTSFFKGSGVPNTEG